MITDMVQGQDDFLVFDCLSCRVICVIKVADSLTLMITVILNASWSSYSTQCFTDNDLLEQSL